MLSDDQIDYLFQIKESKQPIPEGTVRVMLKALSWSPEEIKHGLIFLKRAPQEETPAAARARMASLLPKPQSKPTPLATTVKQNPFPVGSPFTKILRDRQEKKRKRLTLLGGILGAIVFLAGLIVYARFRSLAGF